RSVQDHLMIAHLVEMWNILDKIRPFKIKLKNYIKKFIEEDKIDLIKRAPEKDVMNLISVGGFWLEQKLDETIHSYEEKGESLQYSEIKADNMKVSNNGGKQEKETVVTESKEILKEISLSRTPG
ncbi:hypothetical protein KI387_043061, partial [Taxus chinensis]